MRRSFKSEGVTMQESPTCLSSAGFMFLGSLNPVYPHNPVKKIRTIVGHKNAQNKPNFQFCKIALSLYLLKTQVSSLKSSCEKTKPNTNPNKPNIDIPDPDPGQSQFFHHIRAIREIRGFNFFGCGSAGVVVDKNGVIWDKLGVIVDNVGVVVDKLGVIVDNVGVSNVTYQLPENVIFSHKINISAENTSRQAIFPVAAPRGRGSPPRRFFYASLAFPVIIANL
jgi:hypothetical protein